MPALPLHPLRGAAVSPSYAAAVSTPAYDALTAEDRRRIAVERPDSFLNALPPETDDVTTTDLAACARAVERLVGDGRFVHRPKPFVAVYRLRTSVHTQTALLCDLDTSAVDDGVVVGHERTRPARVDHLVQYLREVRVASSPVCVMHDDDTALATALAHASAGPPHIAITEPDLTQELWLVEDDATVHALLASAQHVGPLVITDGHHRIAASRRFAEEATGPSGHRALVALFAMDGVQMREFNRVVTPTKVSPPALVDAISDAGVEVEPLSGPERPQAPADVTMTADGRWWRLTFPPQVQSDDVVDRLDVSMLHDLVLGPLLGVPSHGSDPRLQYVPGVMGLDVLSARAADGVGFALHPMATDTVAAIARAGRTLPAKSTYLHPKARSGLLLLPRR